MSAVPNADPASPLPAPTGLLARVGQPWVAAGLGKSPARWALVLTTGACLAWLALTYPGGITGDPSAGTGTGLAWATLLAVLPLIAIVDARLSIIPNRVLLPVAVTVGTLVLGDLALASLDIGLVLRAALSSLIVGGYTFAVWFVAPAGGFGWGDVKLSALAGFVLGTKSVWVAALGIVVLPALIALIPMLALAARRDGPPARIPFGPFIVAGVLVAAFFGQDLTVGI